MRRVGEPGGDGVGEEGQRQGADDEGLEPVGGGAAGGLQDEKGGALVDEEHGEGHDDVGDAGDDDEEAVEGSEEGALDEDEGHDEEGEFGAGAVHEARGGDAGQRHHRGDREVDAAGDDDDGLGGGGEGVGERGAGERAEVGAAVAGLDQAADQKEDEEEGAEAEDPAFAAEGAGHAAAPIMLPLGAGRRRRG